ncbi:hypothetical protein PM082_021554 [Marasmius tenuissimus]|nr:hypothetical protein PM082_021554 [Marasmius tenuissimus]
MASAKTLNPYVVKLVIFALLHSLSESTPSDRPLSQTHTTSKSAAFQNKLAWPGHDAEFLPYSFIYQVEHPAWKTYRSN